MRITRINTIKKHRVFDAFSWPANLPAFSRFNVIYGWNGCGKTTFSNLFRYIERKEAITEGEVAFHIDDKVCLGNSLSLGNPLPRVRVFNRDYVGANIFASSTSFSPIFFLGEDSVEKQKQIEILKKELDTENQTIIRAQSAKETASGALDRFCIQQARAIKELLSSSGSNSYNNYDKADFRKTCQNKIKSGVPSMAVDEQEKNKLKQQKDGKPKDVLTPVSLSLPDLEEVKRGATAQLQRTVVSQVLEELAKDTLLAPWVQAGLALHTGEHPGKTCRFCEQAMPEGRIAKLEAHFNDEYNNFLVEIDAAIEAITGFKREFKEMQLPDKALLYEHLSISFTNSRTTLKASLKEVEVYLNGVLNALVEKRKKPFESMQLEVFLAGTPLPDTSGGLEALNSINALVAQHNAETADFANNAARARKALEECMVLEILEDYKTKVTAVQAATNIVNDTAPKVTALTGKIAALERDIVEHRKPAEELNRELRSYLGRDELTFEVKETGYQITRSSLPAANLSEGERTAIAFLYFLKSLQDKGFELAQDIVVIDDPVSSLDANALFSAFGFMRERTKEAGQLFILTHNFAFFRQVKNWFNHLPGQNKKDPTVHLGRFYMLETSLVSGQRNCALKTLDPLLHEFESEYHYIFSRVYNEANRSTTTGSLEHYYSMPNMARRLLEAFLAFRLPGESGELRQQFDKLTFDSAKKARILRFLHTYSHDGRISEPEHDLSILAETPQVLKETLELIANEDPKHYQEMVKLVSPVQVPPTMPIPASTHN